MRLGVPAMVFLILFTLKLLGKITLSWLWVTAPLWGGVALFGGFALFCLIMALVAGQLGGKR